MLFQWLSYDPDFNVQKIEEILPSVAGNFEVQTLVTLKTSKDITIESIFIVYKGVNNLLQGLHACIMNWIKPLCLQTIHKRDHSILRYTRCINCIQ